MYLTGKFAYIRATTGYKTHSVATLTTPSMSLTSSCVARLSFAYSMYGENMGELDVKVGVELFRSQDDVTLTFLMPSIIDLCQLKCC